MKFIIASTVLLKNLQLISGVINPSNTLPILDDFLFELKEKSLLITASDLETTMSVVVDLDMAEDPGIVTIPAKEIVMYCGNKPVKNQGETLWRYYPIFLWGEHKISFDTTLTKLAGYNSGPWEFNFEFHLKEVDMEQD